LAWGLHIIFSFNAFFFLGVVFFSFEDLNVQKKRNDAFSTEKLDLVKQYFTRSDMVRPLPCLSLAGKDTKVKLKCWSVQ
jgi:hypothetical protein